MSAPVVLQATPSDQETDVVLGQAIIVAFDQAINTSTLNDSTFSLTFPAPTQVLTSGQLVAGEAAPSTVNVEGVWSFADDTLGRTIATFTPNRHFQENTLYTACLLYTSPHQDAVGSVSHGWPDDRSESGGHHDGRLGHRGSALRPEPDD